MLIKLAFYEQRSFALIGINSSDFFALSQKNTFYLIHYSRLLEAIKWEQYVTEEWNQIYRSFCCFGDKIINTSSI